MSQNPPFTLTNEILSLASEISELVGRDYSPLDQVMDLKLRGVNQIKTICGSLAIEGNTLSEEQITALLHGKPVVAPAREIQEARNAIKVYEQIETLNPKQEGELLRAHEMLMLGLADEIGHYRSSGVGVMSGKEVVHMAPPADRVPHLMQGLFQWLESTEAHPLVASSVFHYEFEFIHPFSDGNGRMGRLWQSLILGKWQPLFFFLPVESMVHQNQQAYYEAIRKSTKAADSAPFIEFMLNMMKETLNALSENAPVNAPLNAPVNFKRMSTPEMVLALVEENKDVTRPEMAEQIGKDLRTVARAIAKLQEQGRLRRVGSDKSGHWEVTAGG